MSIKSDRILACCILLWAAAMTALPYTEGESGAYIAALPAVASARNLLSQAGDFIDRAVSRFRGADHSVRLDCTGTLRTAGKREPEPRGYSAVINTDKKLLTINDYQPVQLVEDGDILTVTEAGDGVNTVILNPGTHILMVGFQEEGGARTGLFNGTCKRVDPLF
jgi:hypothetical protein